MVFLVTYVVPNFAELYTSMQAQLPNHRDPDRHRDHGAQLHSAGLRRRGRGYSCSRYWSRKDSARENRPRQAARAAARRYLDEIPGGPVFARAQHLAHGRAQAQAAAARYRCEFVDLREGAIDHDLFRSIPVDLMFRYNFVPLKAQNGTLEIALADPATSTPSTNSACCSTRSCASKSPPPPRSPTCSRRPSNPSASSKKSPKASRSTSSATKTTPTKRSPSTARRRRQRHRAGHQAGRHHHLQRPRAARQRHPHRIARPGSRHQVPHRRRAALRHAPIAKDWHSTIISRIKVMSELDIAERRVPQDGRFRVRYKGRLIDFRVSIMPTIHGEDAVLRVLDKESMSEKFAKLSLDVVASAKAIWSNSAATSPSPTAWCWSPAPPAPAKPPRSTPRSARSRTTKTRSSPSKTRRVSAQGHHPDSGQREERAHLRARPALHPAPRSRQDHGRRNPRSGNRPDRHQLRAHRPPGLHHRPRQQRGRRARPLPQHRRRGLQLRLRAELHPGAAPGAHQLRALQAGPQFENVSPIRLWSKAASIPPNGACRIDGRRRLFRMRRHRLSRPHRHPRVARPQRQNPRTDSRPPAHFRNQAPGPRRGHDLPARIRRRKGAQASGAGS
jgi:hypothetical protein